MLHFVHHRSESHHWLGSLSLLCHTLLHCFFATTHVGGKRAITYPKVECQRMNVESQTPKSKCQTSNDKVWALKSEGWNSEGRNSEGWYSEGRYSKGWYFKGRYSKGWYSEGWYSEGWNSEGWSHSHPNSWVSGPHLIIHSHMYDLESMHTWLIMWFSSRINTWSLSIIESTHSCLIKMSNKINVSCRIFFQEAH